MLRVRALWVACLLVQFGCATAVTPSIPLIDAGMNPDVDAIDAVAPALDTSVAPDSTAPIDTALPDRVLTDIRDATSPPDTTARDTSIIVDAALFACEALDARFAQCGAVCDAEVFAWNGSKCSSGPSCECVGSDCAQWPVFDSRVRCEAAFAHCKPSICRATGGRWIDEPSQLACGDFLCGNPPPEVCLRPYEVCDCGPGKIYLDGIGCREEPRCTRALLCTATLGRLALCDSECGVPTMTCSEPEAANCDCGPARRFDPASGCVPASCNADRQAICEWSGGAWVEGICGDDHCGRASDLDCEGPGCRCGYYEVFDSVRGCVRADECFTRFAGEFCNEDSPAPCGLQAVCCGGFCRARCCGPSCDFDTGCPR